MTEQHPTERSFNNPPNKNLLVRLYSFVLIIKLFTESLLENLQSFIHLLLLKTHVTERLTTLHVKRYS